jgi:hypothetical protein
MLKCFLLSYFFYSQIWLTQLMDGLPLLLHHQIGKKRKKKKKVYLYLEDNENEKVHVREEHQLSLVQA